MLFSCCKFLTYHVYFICRSLQMWLRQDRLVSNRGIHSRAWWDFGKKKTNKKLTKHQDAQELPRQRETKRVKQDLLDHWEEDTKKLQRKDVLQQHETRITDTAELLPAKPENLSSAKDTLQLCEPHVERVGESMEDKIEPRKQVVLQQRETRITYAGELLRPKQANRTSVKDKLQLCEPHVERVGEPMGDKIEPRKQVVLKQRETRITDDGELLRPKQANRSSVKDTLELCEPQVERVGESMEDKIEPLKQVVLQQRETRVTDAGELLRPKQANRSSVKDTLELCEPQVEHVGNSMEDKIEPLKQVVLQQRETRVTDAGELLRPKEANRSSVKHTLELCEPEVERVGESMEDKIDSRKQVVLQQRETRITDAGELLPPKQENRSSVRDTLQLWEPQVEGVGDSMEDKIEPLKQVVLQQRETRVTDAGELLPPKQVNRSSVKDTLQLCEPQVERIGESMEEKIEPLKHVVLQQRETRITDAGELLPPKQENRSTVKDTPAAVRASR